MASMTTSARLAYLTEAAHLLRTTSPTVSNILGSTRNDLTFVNNPLLNPNIKITDFCSACGAVLIPGASCSVDLVRPAATRAKNSRHDQSSKSKRPSISSKDRTEVRIKSQRRLHTPLQVQNPLLLVYTCNTCQRKTRLHLPEKNQRHAATPSTDKTTILNRQNASKSTSIHPDRASAKTVPREPPSDSTGLLKHASNLGAHSYQTSATSASSRGHESRPDGVSKPNKLASGDDSVDVSPAAGNSAKKRTKARKQGGLQAMLSKSAAAAAQKRDSFNLTDFLK